MKLNKRAAVVPFFTPYVALIIGILLAIGVLIYGVWINNEEDLDPPPIVDSTTNENSSEETLPELDDETSMPGDNDDVVEKDPETPSVDTDNNEIPDDVVTDNPVDSDDIIDDDVSEDIQDEIIEDVPLQPEEEVIIQDIVTVEVKLYNNNREGFNLVDGREYLEDIVSYLKMHAPDNLLISAAATMSYTEGGSGKAGVYTVTNNCFGIRAYSSWKGYVYARSTGKVYKDYETAKAYGASDFFRAYDSMEDSVKDYINLMCGDYYKDVLTVSSPDEYFAFVLSKGYGEAELYDMWLSVLNLYKINEWAN